MNAVVFYSNTGQSEKIANYFAKMLCYPILEITKAVGDNYENLVLIFPVHCQNIPDVVKGFLKELKAKYLTVIATYGKMCCGNVLYEIQNRYSLSVVAGAYVPCKHTYLDNDDEFCDFYRFSPIIEKIKSPCEIKIPKLYKNPLSNLFPTLRSRIGIKIYKNSDCNNCGVCSELCGLNAIEQGVPNGKCIRCLKCVRNCPSNALSFSARLPMKAYLSKKRMDRIIVYT